jgi:hypothetical protein
MAERYLAGAGSGHQLRRRLWIIFAIAVLAVGAFLLWPRGVKAVVRNAGTAAMQDVHVVVTGHTYTLGDIQPKEIRSVRVKPTGESRITIRYTDASGTSKHVDVDCYIESGYAGSISVDVANGAVTRQADSIRVGPL